jgi:tRNA A37 methylthiotransferase MiaB
MTIRTGRRAGLPVLDARATTAVSAGAPAVDAPRIGLVTLGCDKNTVDSERLLARLAGAGARAVDAADADVVVINTCGFIDIAKEESVDAILDAVRLKAEGRVRAVVAMGCMVQRYKEELAAELPEVDLFLGLTEAERLVPELRARGLLGESTTPVMERPQHDLVRWRCPPIPNARARRTAHWDAQCNRQPHRYADPMCDSAYRRRCRSRT